MQNSGVQIVLPAARWAKYGRTVKYQSRPLVILMPFGPVSFVYDIADTEGKPIPDHLINLFTTAGEFNPLIYNRIIMNCSKENILLREEVMHKSSAGFAKHKNGIFSITINSSYSVNEKYSTLIHELAHIFCGHLGVNEQSWWKNRESIDTTIAEIEAESISFLVCKRIGLETTSEAYLSNYISKHSQIPPISFDSILTISLHIEKMSNDGFLSKTKKKK